MTRLRHRRAFLGNRIATTDALGNTIYRAYDPLGNIIAEWGATYPVRYTYDTAGRRTSLSTTRSATSTFQPFNLSTFQLVQWDTTTWAYDAATGNCLSKTYADGSTVTYTYTPDRLDTGYSLTLSNGVVFSRSLVRDDFRRSLVTGISSVANGVGIGSLSYTYDALNRPTSRNDDAFGYNEQGVVVRKFVECWTFQRVSEKGEDKQFWNSRLRNVLVGEIYDAMLGQYCVATVPSLEPEIVAHLFKLYAERVKNSRIEKRSMDPDGEGAVFNALAVPRAHPPLCLRVFML